jgi:hypothetical protein
MIGSGSGDLVVQVVERGRFVQRKRDYVVLPCCSTQQQQGGRTADSLFSCNVGACGVEGARPLGEPSFLPSESQTVRVIRGCLRWANDM